VKADAGSSETVDAGRLAKAFVHAGVARFAARRLASPLPLLEEVLVEHDPGALLGTPAGDWTALCRVLAGAAPRLGGPLGQLLRDFRLQLHEWFLLALAGETEDSYPLVLALAELQAPAGQPRASLHLCTALCAELFGARVSPLALADHLLVRAGVLRTEGEGPLPLAGLAVSPQLWAVLGGDRRPWPGLRPLVPGKLELLPDELKVQVPQLAELLRAGAARAVVFRGSRETTRAAAAQLAESLGLWAVEMAPEQWEERPVLAAACRYGGWLPVLAPRLGPGEQLTLGEHPGLPVPLVVRLGREGAVEASGLVEVEIPPLSLGERRGVWDTATGEGHVPPGADLALLDGPAIVTVAERAGLDARRRGEALGAAHVGAARRQLGADRLRLLAQPLTRRVEDDALVLPGSLAGQFEDLVSRCLHRERLWEGLGVTLQCSANPGVRALFVGESGTGKTLAAAHLATRLNAPLYRVDLSAVMNKYVGESEKNLGLVLDEAAAHDVILLLDEADALFGRRTDGGETGERYANMLTNFLLTRIETHPGIVVLTSNSRSRIDPSFTRRLDAILEFPLPGGEERRRLWEAHLGGRSPGKEPLQLLAAYCDLPGGNVRNAVLNAAARSDGDPATPLETARLVAALADEYRKLGRELPPPLRALGR